MEWEDKQKMAALYDEDKDILPFIEERIKSFDTMDWEIFLELINVHSVIDKEVYPNIFESLMNYNGENLSLRYCLRFNLLKKSNKAYLVKNNKM